VLAYLVAAGLASVASSALAQSTTGSIFGQALVVGGETVQVRSSTGVSRVVVDGRDNRKLNLVWTFIRPIYAYINMLRKCGPSGSICAMSQWRTKKAPEGALSAEHVARISVS
jgi:hypothetical protein